MRGVGRAAGLLPAVRRPPGQARRLAGPSFPGSPRRRRQPQVDAVVLVAPAGAVAAVSGAGTMPPAGPAGFQVDLRIFGSEGLLMLDCERARLELRRHDGRRERRDLPADAGAYSCEGPPNNFVDLILGETETNWSPGEAAMRSVLLLDAAYRSAQSGKPEQV